MPERLRLQRLSGALYWVALGLSVLLPVIILIYAGKAVTDPASLLSRAPSVPAGTVVTSAQAGLVSALALVAVLPMVAALRGMVRLFDNYRAGEVLNVQNSATILRIGRNLLLVALFAVLVPTLQTLVLSWNAPQKILAIGLDGGTLGFLVTAGLLTVIGWALREAAQVKAENEGFI
ncbi:DUF2975 domain-containing protein [Tabrizicola sp.]|uniref:DUF2975 domain-containing protein n=1 Tax=Tabrizicola sp. TaxID=2005166 RepID=UPI002733ABD3|nr:DUF2975 domain-containing protein [Tabrizicola sp.]MDP3195960.1 DUF2975 domain-containing protein [Tabrizicola sp.]